MEKLSEQELKRIKSLDFDIPRTTEEIQMVRKFLLALPDLENED